MTEPTPVPAPVDEAPSPTWATLVEAIAALPPAPPGPYPDRGLRGRVAAAILARIKLATVEPTPPWSGQIGSLLAATEYDLADVALAELAPELARAEHVGRLEIALRANQSAAIEAAERAEEATAALAEVLAAITTYGATGAHTTPGEHIHAPGRISAEQLTRWQRIAHPEGE